MLSFTNAVGNIFPLLGRLGGVAKKLRTYQNDAKAIMTNVTDGVVAHTKLEPDVQAIMGSSYLGVLGSTGGSVTGVLQSVAEAYLNRLVFRDAPKLGQTLTSSNTAASLGELIRQMEVAGATVRAQTVAGSVGAFTGQGDGVLVVSVKRPVDGKFLENLFAEVVTAICTNDSYLGSATAGQETLSLVGTGAQSDPFAFDWPLGSGASGTINCIDGGQSESGNNILINSGFESFTSNVPDDWNLIVGTAGTDFVEENTLVFDPEDSGSALKIVGDGATLAQLSQTFEENDLDALTQYSICLWLRRDGVAPSTGVLTIDWFDGSAIVNDEAGTPNSFTVDLTTLSTDYAPFTGVFRTPLKMPATISIRIRLSTALESGRAVYADRMSMGEMVQFYVGGPFVACHSGRLPFITGDYAYLTFTNSRGAGGSLDSFQTLAIRLFPSLANNELLLPSSSTPTLDDALIY